MVKLEWENKRDVSATFNDLQRRYKNCFEQIKISHPSKTLDSPAHSSIKDNWTNKLLWGDNLEALYYLLEEFNERIDLIYIDPPFFSGSDYLIEVAESEDKSDILAYRDYWEKDLDSYLQMLYERLFIMKKLLSKNGLIFVHLDWHASHYVKMILDDLFEKRFVNNIVWYYYNKYSAGKKLLPRAHDDILVYSKSDNYTFNEIRIPRKKPRKQLKRTNVNGVLKNAKDENGKTMYRIVTDKKIDDVWKIPCMQPASKEWTGYPTQKHHDLLERIIKLGSNEGDLVADFFCGSGTTLIAAEKLRRRWIGCDNNKYSIYLTLKRINNFQKNSKHLLYSPELLAHLTPEKCDSLNDDFFSKNLTIKTKKK